MRSVLSHTFRLLPLFVSLCAPVEAQVAINGRVVDENGAGVSGARVEFRGGTGFSSVTSSDAAGNFRAALPATGEYMVRVERLGFFVYTGQRQQFEPGSQLTVRLNHLQEFADKID